MRLAAIVYFHQKNEMGRLVCAAFRFLKPIFMKKAIPLAIFLTAFLGKIFGQLPLPSAGKIDRFENFQSKFVAPRNIDVWLPNGFDPAKKYAVLYMHDGQMLFDSSGTWNKQEWGVDECVTKLLAENRIRDCIVVGIWNGGKLRHSEYFPQKPFEMLPKIAQDSIMKKHRSPEMPLFAAEIQSDNYLRFLVKELKPFIDKKYPTRHGRADTFIAGSSMGGLISMYAMCEYPKIFGGAACLSTHWPGIMPGENNPVPAVFLKYFEKKLPSPKTHRFYFDHGLVGLDVFYAPFQAEADAILQKNGFDQSNWLTKIFPEDDHSEASWRKRLDVPVLFLLKK